MQWLTVNTKSAPLYIEQIMKEYPFVCETFMLYANKSFIVRLFSLHEFWMANPDMICRNKNNEMKMCYVFLSFHKINFHDKVFRTGKTLFEGKC